MIKYGSNILIIDNSGVISIKCIGILKKKFFNAHIGDIIIGVVKKVFLKKNKIKKSDIVRAILIREKISLKYINGYIFNYLDNSAILINFKENMIGTRIFGYTPLYLKEKKFLKLSSIVIQFI